LIISPESAFSIDSLRRFNGWDIPCEPTCTPKDFNLSDNFDTDY